MPDIAWIAADWGNTNLRLWALDAADTVIAERRVARGFSVLEPADWEGVLLEACGDLLPADRVTEVLICGAAGSRGGWAEAPYRSVPASPNGGPEAVAARVSDARLSVHVLPGLNQLSPPAVMRSEETQIQGFLSKVPDFDGVVCLPGTHTKWAHVSAGEVVSFMSCMTGELFGLLSSRSILRRTIAPEGEDEAAFMAAVSRAMSHPDMLIRDLIALRAEALLAGLEPVSGRSRLSGLLVGADLRAARMYWLGREVAVVGAEAVAGGFARALSAQGVAVRRMEGAEAALAGLVAAQAARRAAGLCAPRLRP